MSSDDNTEFFLRAMGLEDLDRIADWFMDFEDVAFFERNLPVPVSTEYRRESWKTALTYSDPPRALWYLVENEQHGPAGLCGLQSINYIHGDAVVPIFVGQKMRGKGLAVAMAMSVINIAFDKLRLHRLTTVFREDNHATRAITSKLGFKEEGRLREASYSNGARKDMVQVGLLKSDWTAIRDTLDKTRAKSSQVVITPRRVVP